MTDTETLLDEIYADAESRMKKAIESANHEMGAIRTGRANPMMLDRVVVDYYGSPTPVRQLANVSVQEGQTLVIQPYDKSALSDIEKAIAKSDLNLPPNNDGTVIRMTVPPPSEERRKELVKQVKQMGEDGKVAVRNVRRDATDDVDRLKKEENLSEDEVKRQHERIQKLTDRYVAELDTLVGDKEKEVLTV